MRNKLTVDFFNIKEDRRGGDKFDYTVHEADIAEAVSHDVTTGAVTYEQFLRTSDVWSIYFSGQNISRDSYYGADQSLEDYGKTHGFTCVAGSQYNMKFERSDLTFGIEDREEWLKDMKLGYPDIANAVIEGVEITDIPHTDNVVIANQKSDILGAFAQYEAKFGKLDASVGGRFDHYGITDNSGDGSDKSGNVFSPRVTLKYDLFDCLQARLSYSHGYRAPQIYDEDLHVESSGVRQVIHRNDPDLKPETSHSLMASLDFNRKIGHTAVGLLAEGFYTQLNNAFVNDYGTPDEDGVVIYTRTNAAGGAIVKGVNLELNVIPGKKFSFKSGLTMQSSSYRDAQEFDEKRFFRTPNNYGYWNMDWKPVPSLGISSSADYTGKMLVPYFGPTLADPDEGELRESDPFFDLGIKVRYNIRLDNLTLQVFTGSRTY
jgi:outer membrane receptor for ferrienterochelin and colicins